MSYYNRSKSSDKYAGARTPSEQTFECFVCKKNDVPGVMCRLAGKDDQGYPIRIELDGVTPHRHRKKGDKDVMTFPQQQQQQQAASALDLEDLKSSLNALKTNVNALINNTNTMNQKLDIAGEKLSIILSALKVDPTDDDGDSQREDPDRSDYE